MALEKQNKQAINPFTRITVCITVCYANFPTKWQMEYLKLCPNLRVNVTQINLYLKLIFLHVKEKETTLTATSSNIKDAGNLHLSQVMNTYTVIGTVIRKITVFLTNNFYRYLEPVLHCSWSHQITCNWT
jgi:hypothetical protein